MIRRTTNETFVDREKRRGRRTQFPITLFLASTIHRIIGQTCYAIGARLDQNDPNFRIWQREQLLVLLSRTRSLKDVHFVNDPATVCNAISQIYLKQNQWTTFIDDVVKNHAIRNLEKEAELFSISPFMPYFKEIPRSPAGFVFVLISYDRKQTLLGHARDVVQKIQEINSGKETEINRGHYHWSLLCLISGFISVQKDLKNDRKMMLSLIQGRIGSDKISPKETISIIKDIVNEENKRRDFLREPILLISIYNNI